MPATVKVIIHGVYLDYDTHTPLPQTLPRELDCSKLHSVSYGQLEGNSDFGGEVTMGWVLTAEHNLTKKEADALKAQGWVVHGFRSWWLVEETVRIPEATERPEHWPPAHLEIAEKGIKMYGVRNTPHVDFVSMKGAGVPTSWGFYVTQDQYPTLPLRARGEIWKRGWDIPTCYAIDASGRCWKDGGHGPNLAPCGVEDLLAEFETSEERNAIRKHLGMKLEMPQWMKWAREAGWTPPAGWSASQYEE